jgi:urate oxidase
MSSTSTIQLTAARYGKDKVRVFRVVHIGRRHHIVEYNVTALLEGDIATRLVCFEFFRPLDTALIDRYHRSYTDADNSVVVATDSSLLSFCI